ncbi:MAG: response regulator transcription factor [Pseudomonadota bacterium]
MSHSILVVDDDPHIRDVVCFALDKAGMTTRAASDGAEALAMTGTVQPDLIVLDINMPEMDGLELCRSLRRTSEVPILFLSSRDDEIDRVLGLELGADDYVTKPFSPRELVARINAILKRTRSAAPTEEADATVRIADLEIDPAEHRARWSGSEISLTATEFQMLLAFARQPRRVFTRDDLMRAVYAPGIHVSDRTLDSHVRHVRAKLADAGARDLIETVHGVGFRLTPP